MKPAIKIFQETNEKPMTKHWKTPTQGGLLRENANNRLRKICQIDNQQWQMARLRELSQEDSQSWGIEQNNKSKDWTCQHGQISEILIRIIPRNC